jgi:NHL repeat
VPYRGRCTTILAGLAAMLCLAAPATAAPGDISTFAGNGTAGFSGDSGPATSAALNQPTGVAWLGDGSVLVADYRNHRIRRISPGGVISTVAGTGTAGFSGDGGPATSARLNSPTDVEATPDGGFLIADLGNRRVRKVFPGGTIATVAGNGQEGSGGNGGPATSASLSAPTGVASRPDGGFLVADSGAGLVRAVSGGGTITTIAGGGWSETGDGPATSALLRAPVGVAVLPDGGFVVSEYEGHRVRRVSPGGTITRLAGTGTAGFSGDGDGAATARLNRPVGVSATQDGGVLIGDSANARVRKVSAGGTITTLAGTGQAGFAGDGGPAASARLSSPYAAVESANGAILIADGANNRLRHVEGRAPVGWMPPGGDAPAAEPPRVKVPGRTLYASANGTVRLQVGCPATETARCRGTVSLLLQTGKRRATASAARTIALARRSFSVAPGDTKRIKLRLSRTGRRLLRKRRTLTVRAVVARRGGPNIGKGSKKSVTLKLKRKRRG